MSKFANRNVLLIALTASVLAVTGCASKSNKSQVAVAPLGLDGAGGYGNGVGGYDGGAIVSNSGDVADSAGNLQSVVYFAFDSSDITSQAEGILNQHAGLLGSNPGASVLVGGHTDPRGSREYNMALGERRAQAVQNFLSATGVNPGNIQVVSRGEEEPASAGNSESDYAQDRRAVLSY